MFLDSDVMVIFLHEGLFPLEIHTDIFTDERV